MKYKILYANYIEKLEEDVNKAISEGWTPQGGVSSAVWEYEDYREGKQVNSEYCQAMTKNEYKFSDMRE